MDRIYHDYTKWECYQYGMYKSVSKSEKEEMKYTVIKLFNNEELTIKYMNRVICEWEFSCENFLTNPSINKIAYIGQSACCLYKNIPNLATMYAWKFLSIDAQVRSNKIAIESIKLWKSKRRLENILNHGKKGDTQTGSQMKLLLS